MIGPAPDKLKPNRVWFRDADDEHCVCIQHGYSYQGWKDLYAHLYHKDLHNACPSTIPSTFAMLFYDIWS